MFWSLIVFLVLLFIVVWAVRARVFIRRSRQANKFEGAVASPASIALGELVAVAGGIYLSMVLVATFLQIPLAEHVTILNTQVDPLALGAIVLALVQPIALSLYYKYFSK